MTKFSEYEFRTQPWFDESWFAPDSTDRFSQFIPMKTIVIHCFDPRAAEIPQAVADYLGDEVYPGAFTPETLIGEFHDHHHADIADMFDHDSLAIGHYEDSIRHDVKLLRASAAVPKNVKLYGFFYEMNSGKLTEVVRDFPAEGVTP